MENLICLDSSVLINHYRENNKATTFFHQLASEYDGFVLSVIAEFEILVGASNPQHELYWYNLLTDLIVLPLSNQINKRALLEIKKLRKTGSQLEFKDLIIGCTALHNNLPLATLNEKHFNKIEGLVLLTPSSLK